MREGQKLAIYHALNLQTYVNEQGVHLSNPALNHLVAVGLDSLIHYIPSLPSLFLREVVFPVFFAILDEFISSDSHKPILSLL